MFIYNYDDNGDYLSTEEADESPLEPGIFLIPRNATDIEPPANIEGKIRRFTDGSWSYVDVVSPEPIKLTLDELKMLKIEELNQACNNDICEGFISDATGVPHKYRFNLEEDQHNFEQQTIIMILKPEIESVMWKTEDAGPILHTREQYLALIEDATQNKNDLIARYWDMKQSVLGATTPEEVESFVW